MTPARLSEFDRYQVAKPAAQKWEAEHISHVNRLCRDSGPEYPPSGSDTIRPQLLTSAHWRWFRIIARQEHKSGTVI